MIEMSVVGAGIYRLIIMRNERNPILITFGSLSNMLWNYSHFKKDLWKGYELFIVDSRGRIFDSGQDGV